MQMLVFEVFRVWNESLLQILGLTQISLFSHNHEE